MSPRAQRYHWINTIVGILDQAYHLDDVERVHVIDIVGRLLEQLNIPDREEPFAIPAPLALEISDGVYSSLLNADRDASIYEPRLATYDDIIVSVEAWTAALLSLITTAYPDLSPEESIVTASILSKMLDAIGIPARAAAFFPDFAVRQSREIDA